MALAAAYYYAVEPDSISNPVAYESPARSESSTNLVSGAQIEASGTVVRVLSDDNDGSRHQRFILELPSGKTLLVAHNIDLAPRIANIHRGDKVEFYGQYESNSQGGVVHWTHHDPQGQHVGGWLRHKGRKYD